MRLLIATKENVCRVWARQSMRFRLDFLCARACACTHVCRHLQSASNLHLLPRRLATGEPPARRICCWRSRRLTSSLVAFVCVLDVCLLGRLSARLCLVGPTSACSCSEMKWWLCFRLFLYLLFSPSSFSVRHIKTLGVVTGFTNISDPLPKRKFLKKKNGFVSHANTHTLNLHSNRCVWRSWHWLCVYRAWAWGRLWALEEKRVVND